MFLATTALTEFWDKEQELLFLGSWCLRYDRRAERVGLRYRVMPSPWNDRQRFYEAAQYADVCAERLLGSLAEYLNDIHRVSHSERYWRIVLGPWLRLYVHALYDRCVHLNEAFERQDSLQTIVLDSASWHIPADVSDWVHRMVGDHFNLQLFSQLCRELGRVFPSRSAQDPLTHRCLTASSGQRSVARRAGAWIGNASESAVRAVLRRRTQVALWDLNVPRSMVWKLALATSFLALPINVPRSWFFSLPPALRDHRREGLAGLSAAEGFERILVRLLPDNLPLLYLEAYETARQEVISRYPKPDRVVVSANGWHYDEPFKFWAAEAQEGGCRLVTAQHGGGYGVYRASPHEQHENAIGDTFLVWGWADRANRRHRNVPSPSISEYVRAVRTRRPGRSLLFVAAAHPRYLYLFRSSPVGSQVEDYLQWQARFLEALPDGFRRFVVFRPYPHPTGYGQAFWERIADSFPEVVRDVGRSLAESVRKARVVVVDHPDTTLLEVLAADVPTLCFWDRERWEVRTAGEPYFDGLRRAGVLFDSPEAAAVRLADVYDDPRPWWQNEAVRTARQGFVERFALAREDWLSSWVDALEEQRSAWWGNQSAATISTAHGTSSAARRVRGE